MFVNELLVTIRQLPLKSRQFIMHMEYFYLSPPTPIPPASGILNYDEHGMQFVQWRENGKQLCCSDCACVTSMNFM